MPAHSRGPWLTTAAVLFAILAVSNALKPLEIGAQTGFVFLGKRLTGTPNLVLGPLFAAYLAIYAVGIWRMKRYALPMAWLYAAYVVVNLVLFNFRTPPPPGAGVGWRVFGLVYAAVAIGVSAGTARILAKRAHELG
jgi:hypothetical protein